MHAHAYAQPERFDYNHLDVGHAQAHYFRLPSVPGPLRRMRCISNIERICIHFRTNTHACIRGHIHVEYRSHIWFVYYLCIYAEHQRILSRARYHFPKNLNDRRSFLRRLWIHPHACLQTFKRNHVHCSNRLSGWAFHFLLARFAETRAISTRLVCC